VRSTGDLPAGLSGNKLAEPITTQVDPASLLAPDTSAVSGRQNVIVRLRGKSVAKHHDKSPSGRIGHREKLKNDQAAFLSRASRSAPSGRALSQTQMVLNSVFMEVDADEIKALAADPDVYSVHRVRDYEMDLSETVPYIGASLVQAMGIDGAGIRVAVLDSGIDYYHGDLGGSGNPADFAADNPDIIEPGTFPTARVVGGMDFVGSSWVSGGIEIPDPDPLDDGVGGGHGTHVADIIGGARGVAPAVDLYAVKVCSSLSPSCSGIGLIQGMEFAVDPDGDGDPSDAVDIINMSLGSTYGQAFDDDLAVAVNGATALGVLTVASAGNSSDKPYANGTPAGAATALSVAQTQVPSAVQPFITVDGVDYPAVFQPWSVAPTGVLAGPLEYGDGAGGNLNGCAPFAPGSLTGKVVLVDRGACNFTLKIKNIDGGGGIAGIIGLIAPGDPFSGGDGGDRPITIPGYMVSQANSNAMKSQIGNPGNAVIDPAKGVPLVGQMVGSSSRGPQHEETTLIKPEIGAPGASVSAIAGAGTGTGPFGGTSGAAPMVAGSAALLIQSEPGLSPLEVKARLMNTGETDIHTDPVSGLAPITRIGGGEVRVARAAGSTTAAWDADTGQGALSFGLVDVDKSVVNLHKDVTVRNYSEEDVEFSVRSSFRFSDDEQSGAVTLQVPAGKVKVRAGGSKDLRVHMTINGELLPGNSMNSGSEGANPAALTANEFDGYVILDDGISNIHLPWHVLPRKSARLAGRGVLNTRSGSDVISLSNTGIGAAQNDAYSLLAISPNQPEGGLGEQAPTPDIRAVGINTFLTPGCSSGFIWAFAVNTWERQQHLLPVSHQVLLDTNQDGTDDYLILNRDFSGFTTISDGRQVTWAVDLAAGTATIFFFTEHSMNTGNTVLLVCGEQVGLSESDILNTNIDMTVVTQDFYYGGPGDIVTDLTVTPLGEQYLGIPTDIPGRGTGDLEVIDFGPFPGNSPELGVMLFTNGDRGSGARGGATPDTEAMLFMEK
jgi:subtilisin family serine protease